MISDDDARAATRAYLMAFNEYAQLLDRVGGPNAPSTKEIKGAQNRQANALRPYEAAMQEWLGGSAQA
jgi:hypothetical protein